jgi:hypothetical protein
MNKSNFKIIIPFIALLYVGLLTACHSSSNSFSKGDSIYVRHKYREVLYRLIRPLKETDIDTMNISDSEKQNLKLKLNPLAKPYLIGTGYSVSTTKESRSVGQFIEQEKLTVHNAIKDNFSESTFYIIHPNQANLYIGQPYHTEPGPPEGYIWDNFNLYLSSKRAFNTYEPNKFDK